MNEHHYIAASGLKTMFQAQILAIISVVVLVIPILGIIGLIGALVAFVLSLVGLSKAGPAHPQFRTAMTLTLVNIAVGIISAFSQGNEFITGPLGMISDILNLAVVYYVCTAAAALLDEKGDSAQADKGRFVWKLTLVTTIVSVVCAFFLFVPLLNLLAGLGAIIALIAGLVASILYLVFLYNASNSLAS